MSTTEVPQLSQVPSARTLLVTTMAAIAVAIVLLVTAVLPAEYGIDPVGTGRLLGLTAISAPPTAVETPPPAGNTPFTPVQEGPVAHYRVPFQVDTTQLVLSPYQYLEYKYRLQKGATMLYSWTATGTPNYDFHGEPEGLLPKDGSAPPEVTSYDKKPKREASGALTAPFTGIHGWYWENTGAEPLTVTLTTAGYYSAAIEIHSPRDRRPHALTPLDRLIFPAPPNANGPKP